MREALSIIEYWMPISDYKKPNNKKNFFHEMKKKIKKNVGMTITQKSKETRVGSGNGINLCSVYPANNPYIYIGYVA